LDAIFPSYRLLKKKNIDVTENEGSFKARSTPKFFLLNLLSQCIMQEAPRAGGERRCCIEAAHTFHAGTGGKN
jgi:hypothetical protein